jgi:PqqD family protein of HPr-rel-A system
LNGCSTNRAFLRAPGVLIAEIDDTWVAFSAVSGETHLLNDTSVAILELLSIDVPVSESSVCASLSADSGLAVHEVKALIDGVWETFLTAGIAVQAPAGLDSTP